MNKNELVCSIAEKAGLKKIDAEKAANAVFETLTAAFAAGEEARFIGFGTFSVVSKEARTGRNPRTGKILQIPAKKALKFKPGKELKDAVNR
jgi:DNA-binding protein HU-beta